ncbi:hypothetical protein WPG_2263 [Winogradskyella sp. PG-2]|nr:hypothetical protein WPG_2263 [Winogradskyella sp. PG-2]
MDKQNENTVNEIKQETPKVEADSIINFPQGRRIWIALKTTDQKKVAELIGLDKFELTNWKTGFSKIVGKNKFSSRVFITPIINNEWILVTGFDLPAIVSKDFEDFAEELSKTFDHFSYYYIGRETFGLAKANNGILERYIYYNDNSTITEKGNKTNAEKTTQLIGDLEQSRYSEKLTRAYKQSPSNFKNLLGNDEYIIGFDDEIYEVYTIPWPNRFYICKIAEQWSINPTTLIEDGATSEGLGLLGKTNYKYSN